MTPRCVARGCTRPSTSLVEVWFDPFEGGILRTLTGRPEFRAPVCPGHEQEIAEGRVVPVKSLAVFEEAA